MRSIRSFYYTCKMVLRWTIQSIIFLGSTQICAVEHDIFNELLAKYVNSGKVNYSDIQLESRKRLDVYLDLLSRINLEQFINSTESDQLAVYINAYNAFTIATVFGSLASRKHS